MQLEKVPHSVKTIIGHT